jgi:hypothetical protein
MMVLSWATCESYDGLAVRDQESDEFGEVQLTFSIHSEVVFDIARKVPFPSDIRGLLSFSSRAGRADVG